MESIKHFYLPDTISEARKLLKSQKDKAVILAGGTSLSIRFPSKKSEIISLRNLPLHGIEKDGKKVVIGATETISGILKDKKLKDPISLFMKEACSHIASTPLRNLITVGGNIVQLYAWSILPLVIIAADMKIIVQGDKKKKYSAAEFFAKHPVKTLNSGDIVTGIEYSQPEAGEKCAGGFQKFSITEFDYAILNAVVFIKAKKGVITEAKVIAGGLSAIPQTLDKTAAFIKGKNIKDIALFSGEAGKIASEEVKTSGDMRVSAEYKKEISQTLFKRALEDAVAKI